MRRSKRGSRRSGASILSGIFLAALVPVLASLSQPKGEMDVASAPGAARSVAGEQPTGLAGSEGTHPILRIARWIERVIGDAT